MTHALVVEDNADLAANVAELLETLGVEAHVARDADEAAVLAARYDLDLAVVDLRLPNGVSGVDLVPGLKERCPFVECILVTGNATVDSAVAAVRHGAAAYVQKPFDSADLLAIAERVLAQVKLRREREILAAELAHSESLHRGVVETVEALIVTLDTNRRVTFCNRFALQLGGWELPAIVGRPFEELFVGEMHRAGIDPLFGSVARGSTVRGLELVMLRGDATARTVRWTLAPLEHADARSAVLAVGIDMTEMLELQRRTVESEAMAAVGALTTGLAHEIRNPLNAASLQLEALVRGARKVLEPDARERIESRVGIVRSELSRLTSMLDDFLSLARPRGITTIATDLPSLVQEVLELKRPLAEAQGVALEASIGANADVVRCDRSKIKQVLINLVANSLEAMRDQGGSLIAISAERKEGGAVEIAVRDDGPGLPKDEEDLFQAFVTTKEAGTGLGLTIVKKIVAMHGGDVSLGSAPGGGAVARFTLQAG